MTASADRERAQVYAAELAAFDGTDLEAVVGFEVVVDAVRSVVGPCADEEGHGESQSLCKYIT